MTTRPPRRGTAAVELAIVLPFLALIFSAAVDFGRVFHAAQVLDGTANAAAMTAGGTTWVPTADTDAARAAAVAAGAELDPPLRPEQVSVTVAGGTATAVVSYDFPLLTAVLVPSQTVPLQRTCVVRVAPRPGE